MSDCDDVIVVMAVSGSTADRMDVHPVRTPNVDRRKNLSMCGTRVHGRASMQVRHTPGGAFRTWEPRPARTRASPPISFAPVSKQKVGSTPEGSDLHRNLLFPDKIMTDRRTASKTRRKQGLRCIRIYADEEKTPQMLWETGWLKKPRGAYAGWEPTWNDVEAAANELWNSIGTGTVER